MSTLKVVFKNYATVGSVASDTVIAGVFIPEYATVKLMKKINAFAVCVNLPHNYKGDEPMLEYSVYYADDKKWEHHSKSCNSTTQALWAEYVATGRHIIHHSPRGEVSFKEECQPNYSKCGGSGKVGKNRSMAGKQAKAVQYAIRQSFSRYADEVADNARAERQIDKYVGECKYFVFMQRFADCVAKVRVRIDSVDAVKGMGDMTLDEVQAKLGKDVITTKMVVYI